MANVAFTGSVFKKEVIRNLDRKTVLLAATNRAYEGDIKTRGDSVRVQTLPTITFTASSITGAGDFANADIGTGPGGVITASDFALTLENLIVDKYSEKRLVISDHEARQSVVDLETGLAGRFAQGLALLMDNEVRDQILTVQVADIPAANKINSGAPVTLTKDNVYEEMMKVRSALRKQNVMVEDMEFYVGVDVEALLLQSSFLSGSGTAENVLRSGYLGQVGGVPVFVTTALDASNEIIGMKKGSVNAVVQVIETKMTEGTDGFYKNLLAQTVYGMKIFGENAKAIAINYVA